MLLLLMLMLMGVRMWMRPRLGRRVGRRHGATGGSKRRQRQDAADARLACRGLIVGGRRRVGAVDGIRR